MDKPNPDLGDALAMAGYVKPVRSTPSMVTMPRNGLGVMATPDNPVAQRYALTAMTGECDTVAATHEGGRNHQLNVSAVKLGSLVASGLLDGPEVFEALVTAGMAAGLPESECRATTQSGMTYGMTKPREVELTASGMRADTTFDAGTETPSGNAQDGPGATQAPESPREVYARRVYTLRTAGERPPLDWIVPGWFARDTFARLVGSTGTFKTFVSIDLACRIAMGLPWNALPVARQRVHYMVGEGTHGFQNRVRAWCDLNAVNPDDLDEWFTFTDGVAGIGTPEWQGAIEWCEDWKAGFIVGDTQARLTSGFDENSTKDANTVIGYVDRLRVTTRACVLLVHHTGHENGDAGKRGRGSTAFKAAADAEVILNRIAQDKRVDLFLDKAKDAEDKIHKIMDLVTVGETLVMAPETLTSFDPETVKSDPVQQSIMDVLNGSTEWVTTNQIHRVTGGRKQQIMYALAVMVQERVIRCSTNEGINLPRGAVGYLPSGF